MVDLPPPEGPTSASVLPTATSRLRDPYTTSFGRAGCANSANRSTDHRTGVVGADQTPTGFGNDKYGCNGTFSYQFGRRSNMHRVDRVRFQWRAIFEGVAAEELWVCTFSRLLFPNPKPGCSENMESVHTKYDTMSVFPGLSLSALSTRHGRKIVETMKRPATHVAEADVLEDHLAVHLVGLEPFLRR